MKAGISLLLAVFLIACNDDKQKSAEATFTTEDGKTVTKIDIDQAQNTVAAIERRKLELEKLTPFTEEQLKDRIPATLLGNERTDLSVGKSNGALAAEAKYKINDSASIELNVVDCAGPEGAGIYGFQAIGAVAQNTEDENESVKITKANGITIFERVNKKSNESQIMYVAADRFLVTLEGENLPVDALKQAARDIKLK